MAESVWAAGFDGRFDAQQCKPGNKPCGRRCIPQKWNCGLTQAATVMGIAGGATAAAMIAAPRIKRLMAKRVKAIKTPSATNAQIEPLAQDLNTFLNETDAPQPQVRPSGPGAASPQPRNSKPRRPRPMRRKR